MSNLDRDALYPWLAILRAKFMGSSRARVLAEHFGSITAALNAPVDAIAAVPRFNEEMGRAVREAANGKFDDEIDRELKWCERNGVDVLIQSDPKFPEPLKHIPASPALLYVKGKILPQDLLAVGIVGTRTASDAGKRNANRIARDLAEAGITIISGLAWGVDASAHKGALKCKKGRTLAVLGNGLKFIYPKEHQSLYEQVFKRGALITELFPNVAPDKRNFPPRNRIISGLSLGVLIAEAPARSGALITA
ncbi:DNA-processing protein DprA, partial [bacterium]|nr:DNA-processing protein DprA [bacterium]